MIGISQRATRLRERAQVVAETGGKAEHPIHDPDRLEFVFALAVELGTLPDALLDMDGELFTLFTSWYAGRSAGQSVWMERNLP